MSYIRTYEEHRVDQDALASALKMVADGRGKAVPAIGSSTLSPLSVQSVYRIMDVDRTMTFGFVTKTRVMWRYETMDGLVIRSRYADEIAMSVL